MAEQRLILIPTFRYEGTRRIPEMKLEKLVFTKGTSLVGQLRPVIGRLRTELDQWLAALPPVAEGATIDTSHPAAALLAMRTELAVAEDWYPPKTTPANPDNILACWNAGMTMAYLLARPGEQREFRRQAIKLLYGNAFHPKDIEENAGLLEYMADTPLDYAFSPSEFAEDWLLNLAIMRAQGVPINPQEVLYSLEPLTARYGFDHVEASRRIAEYMAAREGEKEAGGTARFHLNDVAKTLTFALPPHIADVLARPLGLKLVWPAPNSSDSAWFAKDRPWEGSPPVPPIWTWSAESGAEPADEGELTDKAPDAEREPEPYPDPAAQLPLEAPIEIGVKPEDGNAPAKSSNAATSFDVISPPEEPTPQQDPLAALRAWADDDPAEPSLAGTPSSTVSAAVETAESGTPTVLPTPPASTPPVFQPAEDVEPATLVAEASTDPASAEPSDSGSAAPAAVSPSVAIPPQRETPHPPVTNELVRDVAPGAAARPTPGPPTTPVEPTTGTADVQPADSTPQGPVPAAQPPARSKPKRWQVRKALAERAAQDDANGSTGAQSGPEQSPSLSNSPPPPSRRRGDRTPSPAGQAGAQSVDGSAIETETNPAEPIPIPAMTRKDFVAMLSRASQLPVPINVSGELDFSAEIPLFFPLSDKWYEAFTHSVPRGDVRKFPAHGSSWETALRLTARNGTAQDHQADPWGNAVMTASTNFEEFRDRLGVSSPVYTACTFVHEPDAPENAVRRAISKIMFDLHAVDLAARRKDNTGGAAWKRASDAVWVAMDNGASPTNALMPLQERAADSYRELAKQRYSLPDGQRVSARASLTEALRQTSSAENFPTIVRANGRLLNAVIEESLLEMRVAARTEATATELRELLNLVQDAGFDVSAQKTVLDTVAAVRVVAKPATAPPKGHMWEWRTGMTVAAGSETQERELVDAKDFARTMHNASRLPLIENPGVLERGITVPFLIPVSPAIYDVATKSHHRQLLPRGFSQVSAAGVERAKRITGYSFADDDMDQRNWTNAAYSAQQHFAELPPLIDPNSPIYQPVCGYDTEEDRNLENAAILMLAKAEFDMKVLALSAKRRTPEADDWANTFESFLRRPGTRTPEDIIMELSAEAGNRYRKLGNQEYRTPVGTVSLLRAVTEVLAPMREYEHFPEVIQANGHVVNAAVECALRAMEKTVKPEAQAAELIALLDVLEAAGVQVDAHREAAQTALSVKVVKGLTRSAPGIPAQELDEQAGPPSDEVSPKDFERRMREVSKLPPPVREAVVFRGDISAPLIVPLPATAFEAAIPSRKVHRRLPAKPFPKSEGGAWESALRMTQYQTLPEDMVDPKQWQTAVFTAQQHFGELPPLVDAGVPAYQILYHKDLEDGIFQALLKGEFDMAVLDISARRRVDETDRWSKRFSNSLREAKETFGQEHPGLSQPEIVESIAKRTWDHLATEAANSYRKLGSQRYLTDNGLMSTQQAVTAAFNSWRDDDSFPYIVQLNAPLVNAAVESSLLAIGKSTTPRVPASELLEFLDVINEAMKDEGDREAGNERAGKLQPFYEAAEEALTVKLAKKSTSRPARTPARPNRGRRKR